MKKTRLRGANNGGKELQLERTKEKDMKIHFMYLLIPALSLIPRQEVKEKRCIGWGWDKGSESSWEESREQTQEIQSHWFRGRWTNEKSSFSFLKNKRDALQAAGLQWISDWMRDYDETEWKMRSGRWREGRRSNSGDEREKETSSDSSDEEWSGRKEKESLGWEMIRKYTGSLFSWRTEKRDEGDEAEVKAKACLINRWNEKQRDVEDKMPLTESGRWRKSWAIDSQDSNGSDEGSSSTLNILSSSFAMNKTWEADRENDSKVSNGENRRRKKQEGRIRKDGMDQW